MDYGYQANGMIDNISYPGSSTQVIYGRDSMGRITTVRDNTDYYIGSANTPGITYRNTGFMSKVEYKNGMIQEFTPDSRNRISQIKLYPKNMPSELLLNLPYTLDGEGNVTAIGTDSYTYDNQNRLNTATVGGQFTGYNLDLMGNRLSVTGPGGAQVYTQPVDHNLLTGDGKNTYTFDTLGNLATKSGGFSYIFDGENRLYKVLQNGIALATYWYDAAGNRVRAAEQNQNIYYSFDGLNIIQEDNASAGTVTDYIYLGKDKVAEKTGTDLKFHHWDHLGSTRLVTDAAGRIVQRLSYEPFGGTLANGDTLYNFDFELGIAVPEKWSYTYWSGTAANGTGSYVSQGINGSKCVTLATLQDGANLLWVSDWLPVNADTNYEFTGSYKCLNTNTSGAKVSIRTCDSSGNELDYIISPVLPNSLDWNTFSLKFHTNPRAVKISLNVRLGGNTGQGVVYDAVMLKLNLYEKSQIDGDFALGVSNTDYWYFSDWNGDPTLSKSSYLNAGGINNSKCVRLDTLKDSANAVFISDYIPIAGNSDGEYTVSYKCLTADTTKAYVSILTYDANNNQLDYLSSSYLPYSDNWNTFKFTFHTNANAVKIRLTVRVGGNAGQAVAYDDVKLKITEPFPNSDFESGTSSPVYWTYSYWSNDATYGTGSYLTSSGVNNSKCVKLETLKTGANILWQSAMTPVSPNADYEFTGSYLCLNTNTITAYVSIRTIDAAGNELDYKNSSYLPNAVSWNTFSFKFHTNPSAVKISLIVRLGGSAGQALIYDAVKLSKLPGVNNSGFETGTSRPDKWSLTDASGDASRSALSYLTAGDVSNSSCIETDTLKDAADATVSSDWAYVPGDADIEFTGSYKCLNASTTGALVTLTTRDELGNQLDYVSSAPLAYSAGWSTFSLTLHTNPNAEQIKLSLRLTGNAGQAVLYDAVKLKSTGVSLVEGISGSGGNINYYSFTGKRFDSVTGLIYFGARWYDPELGRFISLDPIKDGLNWYAYAANNPLKFIDPDGKKIVFAENVTKQQISDFNKAINYLSKNSSTARELIAKVSDPNTLVITIKIDNDAGIGGFTPWNKTITWDPNSSWHVKSKNKNATPALELAHELGHAAQLIDGEYGNDRPKREENDLKVWETPIAKELGEPWRNYYMDVEPWPIETEGPTSNEEVE